MIKRILSSAALTLSVCLSAVAEPSRIDKATTLLPPKPEVVPEDVVEIEVIPFPNCSNCSEAQLKTLIFFQLSGIKDKNALAMIMGSIKQESRFQPAVCEGGFITSWQGCTRGGFGLIQFTSAHRYYGLGDFARRTGQRPESMKTQLEYIVTEREWKDAARIFKQAGLPMSSYDYAGKIWLGYGIKGNRLFYAIDYAQRIA